MSSRSYLKFLFNLTISREILFSLFRFRAAILFIYLLNYISGRCHWSITKPAIDLGAISTNVISTRDKNEYLHLLIRNFYSKNK